jgi:hypothetical protein
MTLFEKVMALYPELANKSLLSAGIILQNDSDGRGDYIAAWNHPTLTRPTPKQLGETQ